MVAGRKVPCSFIFGSRMCGFVRTDENSTCDKSFEMCRDVYQNEDRYGGFTAPEERYYERRSR